MINNKNIDHRPIHELMAIVKNDFKKFDLEGLIDDGNLIKSVMYCNDKLGLNIREIREIAIPVSEYKAKLPLDFEKMFYVCALEATNTQNITLTNPFDNNVDQDIIYEASLDRESLGCVDNYKVQIKRESKHVVYQYGNWVQLEVDPKTTYCHMDCPNKTKKGRYKVEIDGEFIHTPFRSGTLYLIYIGMMKDENGNITFPFHPLITPYYEWTLKESIINTALFNSDAPNLGELWKLANRQRQLAWLDAFNFTTEKSYSEVVDREKKKQLGWYHQWFRYFQ
jgi:hypothetical protein